MLSTSIENFLSSINTVPLLWPCEGILQPKKDHCTGSIRIQDLCRFVQPCSHWYVHFSHTLSSDFEMTGRQQRRHCVPGHADRFPSRELYGPLPELGEIQAHSPSWLCSIYSTATLFCLRRLWRITVTWRTSVGWPDDGWPLELLLFRFALAVDCFKLIKSHDTLSLLRSCLCASKMLYNLHATLWDI
jgi:hypothetical protein